MPTNAQKKAPAQVARATVDYTDIKHYSQLAQVIHNIDSMEEGAPQHIAENLLAAGDTSVYASAQS